MTRSEQSKRVRNDSRSWSWKWPHMAWCLQGYTGPITGMKPKSSETGWNLCSTYQSSITGSPVSSVVTWARRFWDCLLYTSDAADDLLCVDLGGRRIIKK